MKRAVAISILVAGNVLAVAVMTEAQQTKKIPRIVWLAGNFPYAQTRRIEVFRRGLQQLGYVEGRILLSKPAITEGNWISCLNYCNRFSFNTNELIRS
jgi:hypothetical protein